MIRDINSLLASEVTTLLPIINATPLMTTYSASIDTKDHDGLNVSLTPFDNTTGSLVAYTYDTYDDVKITFQESDDDATFTDCGEANHLPTSDTDRILAGTVQDFGVFCTKRYVRIKFVVTVLDLATTKLVMAIAPILWKNQR